MQAPRWGLPGSRHKIIFVKFQDLKLSPAFKKKEKRKKKRKIIAGLAVVIIYGRALKF